MEVDNEDSQWIKRFQECLEHPDSREEVSELVLSLEKLAVEMGKKKVTIDPHAFTKWIVDLGLTTTNLEQAIRLLLAGVKMNHISIDRLDADVNSFREFICYDQDKKDSEQDEEALKMEKLKRKEREVKRKKEKWIAKVSEMAAKFENEKIDCTTYEDFDIANEFLRVFGAGDDNAFETVYQNHQTVIQKRLDKIKRPPQLIKIKKQKKKVEKVKVEKVHFDDAYFEVATSNYEEGNVRGLISLNARRDVRGKVLKVNGKCNFQPKQHELGRPSWFVRDFHKVVSECLKEQPTKELYRVHECFPEPPYDTDEPSGLLFDKYKPFVPEVSVEVCRHIYADCMYINGLSEEEALQIYGIDNELLEDLNKLTKGEGNFNDVMERLRNVIPKDNLRKLIWCDETFDITEKDNLDKVYNPYHAFETINMEFIPDLTKFEEMKRGKCMKIVEPSGETKVFFGREIIPEESNKKMRKSKMLDISDCFDMSQQIHDMTLANEICDPTQGDGSNDDEELFDDFENTSCGRSSRMSFAEVSLLEDSIQRKTDVMEFSQLPRGVDQSHWKYKTDSTKKIPRTRSYNSCKATPKSRKRGSSTSLSQITPKSSRVLRSQTKNNAESTLPQIKEEIIDDEINEKDDDDTASDPGRLPDSDIDGESKKQSEEGSVKGNDDEDDDPSSPASSYRSVNGEQQSTHNEENEDESSDGEVVSETDDEESAQSFVSATMEIDNIYSGQSNNEDTLVQDSDEETIACNTPLVKEEIDEVGPSTNIIKPSDELFKQSISAVYDTSDYFGPFGKIYDEEDLKPIFLSENVPQGYSNVVTEENAHSFGYMAMKYSNNAGKIKCTTNVSYTNAPLIKFAIFDVLMNSSLDDTHCQAFNDIMSLAKTGNFTENDRKRLCEPFKKCLIFKNALEQLCISFRSTFKTRIKELLPNNIVINGHHTLKSIFYCVCQIIPQTKENKLHYLTFVNLLLHMNNKFEMTFIDPSTNEEPDGEAPVTCYIKKHVK